MSKVFGKRREAPEPARPAADQIETLIGAATILQGNVKAEGTIRIDGVVEGDVESARNIIVAKSGKILGALRAQKVLVAGAVKGNIYAESGLEIVATGKVWGDITISSLLIEEGGLFRGQSVMREEQPPEALLLPAAAAHTPPAVKELPETQSVAQAQAV